MSELLDDEAVRALLKEECASVGGQAAFARKYGLSPAFVSQTITGKVAPSEGIVSALGLTVVRRFSNVRVTGSGQT